MQNRVVQNKTFHKVIETIKFWAEKYFIVIRCVNNEINTLIYTSK